MRLWERLRRWFEAPEAWCVLRLDERGVTIVSRHRSVKAARAECASRMRCDTSRSVWQVCHEERIR